MRGAAALLAAPASAEVAIAVLSTCGYPGTQFALDGRGLGPSQKATVEVMGRGDPTVGMPLSTQAVTANAIGRFVVLIDVPATGGTRAVVRSVRVRPGPDRPLGMLTLLGSARLTTAGRGVSVLPRSPRGRAAAIQRWRVTGLPDGTQLWAHYRHGARTVATVALGAAQDPCGRASFALRALPAGHERPGTWDVWITARRAFREPGSGLYVRRRMSVTGSGPHARVTFAPLRSQLMPADPRVVAPRTNFFAADSTRIGVVRMIFGNGDGVGVDFFERIGERLVFLGRARAGAGEETILERAATWSCTRLTRRFVAFAKLRDDFVASGAHTIRTPSCADRFRLSAPRRVTPGATSSCA